MISAASPKSKALHQMKKSAVGLGIKFVKASKDWSGKQKINNGTGENDAKVTEESDTRGTPLGEYHRRYRKRNKIQSS